MQKEERAQVEEERRTGNCMSYCNLREISIRLRKKMQQKAIEEAKAEADKILDSFEEDMLKLQEQVEQLSRANDALTSENYGLRSKINYDDRVPVVFFGDEEEFYSGEIKEMILDALEESLKAATPKTRRYDVLNDILENNAYEKIHEERETIIKKSV